MKNIFKKIGFLCTALLALSLGSSVNKVEEVNAAESKYVKVTSEPTDWSGKYLIVYEAGKVCFDGSLTTLDVAKNNKSITISDDEISSTATIDTYSFEIAKSGSSYTIQSDSGYYIGSTSNSNQLLSNKSTKYTNTISLNSDGSVKIAGTSSILRYNANSSDCRFRYYKSSSYTNQKAIHLYKFEAGSGDDEEHVCSTFVIPETPTHKVSDATCTEAAVYKKVCPECQLPSNNELDVYSYGDPLGHNYDELGTCTRCGEFDSELTIDDRVKLIFNSYYNEGTYTKDTVLNVNKIAEKEIYKYFHASANSKYRRTVYEPNKVSMVLSEDGKSYDNSTLSKYEDKDGKVYHSGLGGNWYAPSEWESVENKFITLNDFANSSVNNWTYENGVYTLDISKNEDMTRFAREFVAPMWLDTADAKNYVNFTTLTVKDTGSALVMQLNVTDGNSGQLEEGANLVFSQATITKGAINLNTLATFEFGTNEPGIIHTTNGNTVHGDGKDIGTSKTYTEGKYSLKIESASKVFDGAFDEKGNSCIKFGTSSAVGSMSFTVPNDVTKVIIYVGKYKTNATKVTINGTTYTLTKSSNNGEYDAIEVDTSTTKKVSFATVSGSARCMLNTIEFYA